MREFALDYIAWSIVGEWVYILGVAAVVLGGIVVASVKKELNRREQIKYLQWDLEQDTLEEHELD
jgi:hypothetical protein